MEAKLICWNPYFLVALQPTCKHGVNGYWIENMRNGWDDLPQIFDDERFSKL